jgi:gas vesicle protein
MNDKKDTGGRGSSFADILVTLVVGLSAGFVVGILFAPKSGKETRREIKEKSEELIEKGRESFDTAVGRTKEYVEKGKSRLAELKDRSEEFIERSREKISDISKAVSSKSEDTGKKVKKVMDKGKAAAKKVEEELS